MTISACGGDSAGEPPVAPTPRPEALTQLVVTPNNPTIFSNSTITLAPTPTVAGSGVTVTYAYASSAPAVATVTDNGVVTAVAIGTATVTVSATGSGSGFTTSTRQATVQVTVVAPPPAITELAVTPDTVELITGGTAALTANATKAAPNVTVALAFASSASAVATVNDAGQVTAVSPGVATITVTATGSGNGFGTVQQQASAVIRVSAPPPALTALSLTPDSLSLSTGATATLTAQALRASEQVVLQVTYSSSASDVASVTNSGQVTAVSAGTAVITVQATGSGPGFTTTERQATALITVSDPTPALTGFSISPDTVVLSAGDSALIEPAITTANNGIDIQIVYRSSNPAVASVSNMGLITAVNPGTAAITATATGSGAGFATTTLEDELTVNVTAIPVLLGVGFADDQFARIEPGSFERGSNDTDFADALPVRTVTISQPFLMQKSEVTVAQWRQVMTGTSLTNPSFDKSCGDACPVEFVTWSEVQTFLQRLNQQDPGKGYRLPTEAEWEYAARAGTTGTYGGGGELSDIAWWLGNASGQKQRVGLKRPNAWGLYDMQGNVWEWVADRYASVYYQSAPQTDPPGPTSGSNRILRGGGVGTNAKFSNVAFRNAVGQTTRGSDFGFRLVRAP